jgi:PleD family two-component response regulator
MRTILAGITAVGVAKLQTSMDETIACADASLYEAKESGRNRVVGVSETVGPKFVKLGETRRFG